MLYPYLQMAAWCDNNFDDVCQFLGDEDTEEEFTLRPKDSAMLQVYLRSAQFHPILASLDTDSERVQARMETQQAIRNFKEYKRDMGLRELSAWLDRNKDDAPEELDQMNAPKIPLPYDAWRELTQHSELPHDDQQSPTGPINSTTIHHMLSYMYNMHWKMDYLLNQQKLYKSAGADADINTLKARYPFLLSCDPHIWDVPNVTPLMLARTSGVCPSPNVCLCVRSNLFLVCNVIHCFPSPSMYNCSTVPVSRHLNLFGCQRNILGFFLVGSCRFACVL
jgi:hypothetical protein